MQALIDLKRNDVKAVSGLLHRFSRSALLDANLRLLAQVVVGGVVKFFLTAFTYSYYRY